MKGRTGRSSPRRHRGSLRNAAEAAMPLPLGIDAAEAPNLPALPRGWQQVPLHAFLVERKQKNREGNSLPVYSVTNDRGFVPSDEFFAKQVYSKDLRTYKVITYGEIAYNPYRVNVGSIALVNGIPAPALVSPAYVVFATTGGLNPQYLLHVLKSPQFAAEIRQISHSRGSVRRSMAFADLARFVVPLPPRREQDAIVGVLEAVRRAHESSQRVVTSTRRMQSSLLQHLLGYGLVPKGDVGQVDLQETAYGRVPAHWRVMPLRDAVVSIDYGYSAPIPPQPPIGGMKIVSTADMTKDGEVLYGQIRSIAIPERAAARLLLRQGDILFNWRNSPPLIGKTAVFDEQTEPHVFASFILRIRVDEVRTHNYFLTHVLNYYREHGVFVTLARRAVNQANYNRNEIAALEIPIPPYEEQRQIADMIRTTQASLSTAEGHHTATGRLYDALVKQMTTGSVRIPELDCDP